MRELAAMDRALDELLVQLGGIVLRLSSPQLTLRLSSPQLTKSGEERRALARSVNQYCVCAASSDDPRVQRLKVELQDALKPRLQLVASR
ncbi:hypothetical protein [Bradyrhizobium sp. Ash2021]|uniref:hypothetical protein n=1 Tax=Bradyrhizobium sp. Ash2021 TaxID=2954771 RepID=UPI0028166D5C|nr:hypothetical protein [Bradyrhizobium sp. Ash2021]WMT74592.1 hypothetical protein NL528_43140 [Bradyrhizobium sp. Ash2021]